VLAGHSFGGLYVQSFAAQFPDDVAGLVLLDSTAPQLGPPLPTKTESYNVFDRVSAFLRAVAHLGGRRLLNPVFYGSLPPRSRDEARANSSTARHLASWLEEFREGSRSMQQASSLTNLDSKPLIVLTADTGHDAKWQSPQDQMAKLSTNSLHVSPRPLPTNRSPRTRPTPPQPASDVVASIRTSQPLAK
jgi:pimeloyl-ACP methyl ester carboxylesterase